jgi:YfiH family protein
MAVKKPLTLEIRDGVPLYVIEDARDCGIDAFFTSRSGGVSIGSYDSLNLGDHVGDDPDHVARNRGIVENLVGAPVRLIRQIHGNAVLQSDEVTSESEGDALVSVSDDAVGIMVADCVPVLLYSAVESQFCVVHAGWKGLVAGVLENAVGRFSEKSDVCAFIGPSISAARYQVGPEVARHFVNVPHALSPDVGDRSLLDLRLVATFLLERAGLTPTHISLSDEVTDGGDTFFSDRACRPCGRFALIARRPRNIRS